MEDPHTAARGMIVETEHPTLGTVKTLASPVKVGNEPVPATRAPHRGEHSDAVLRDLCGYDDARIEALRSAGVLT
jgi:crotonobetainyl-CoA:carnitine CoA-transferase CaiB-like acyl-CoA transferase